MLHKLLYLMQQVGMHTPKPRDGPPWHGHSIPSCDANAHMPCGTMAQAHQAHHNMVVNNTALNTNPDPSWPHPTPVGHSSNQRQPNFT